MDKPSHTLPASLFFRKYFEALEAALNNDNINLGFHVKGPEDYIEEQYSTGVEIFISNNYDRYYKLFDLVESYFDSLSHYTNDVNGIKADIVKEQLNKFILDYKRIGMLPESQAEQ
jgi:hypothetical protein